MYGTMKSIKTSIILITVAIICSGFIAFEIHDFSLTKESALQELEERVTIKADRLAENLELPLWEVDSGWVEKVVGSEMEDKRTYAVIVETDGKILAVALDLGFQSLSRFYGMFKKYYGVSPARYRAMSRRNDIPI